MLPDSRSPLAPHVVTPLPEGGVHCLVVDDDEMIRYVLVRGLAAPGLTVAAVPGGREALAYVREHPETSVVLLDINMPGLDGRAALHELRRLDGERPVIMLSGEAEAQTAVGCLRDGAADFVSKPVILDEIRERIATALERRQLRRERQFYQSRLEQRVEELGAQLRVQFLETLEALAYALEAKDPYTAGHSMRVSVYAGWIAGRAVPERADAIARGARLHDVGKIGVTERVLDKPGDLTPEEIAVIRQHTLLGAHILQPIARAEPTLVHIARSHHERLDGLGFPDGLAGDAIPLEARIVAVADAFDAMTSDRPYRRAMPLEEAVAELERWRGVQWDAALVDHFVAAVRTFGIVAAPAAGSAPLLPPLPAG